MVGTQFAFLNSGFKISETWLRYNEKNPRGKLGNLSSSPGSVFTSCLILVYHIYHLFVLWFLYLYSEETGLDVVWAFSVLVGEVYTLI